MKLPDEIREQFAKLGRKGGKKALETMTPEQRKARASKAGKASGKAKRKTSKKK